MQFSKITMNFIKLTLPKLICFAIIIGMPSFLILNTISGNTLLTSIQCKFLNPKEILGAKCANSIPDPGTPEDAEKFMKIVAQFYGSIRNGEYETSYKLFSTEFKNGKGENGKTLTLDYFTAYWGKKKPEILEIAFAKDTENNAVVFARVKDNNIDAEFVRFQFQFIPNEKNWKINKVNYFDKFVE
jgi:hypothetical protein